MEQLLTKPAVRASGLLFPLGDLDDETPIREPVSYKQMRDWWQGRRGEGEGAVNQGAQLARCKALRHDRCRRGYGRLREAARQTGILEQTLRNIYLQQDRKPKAELAVRLAAGIA